MLTIFTPSKASSCLSQWNLPLNLSSVRLPFYSVQSTLTFTLVSAGFDAADGDDLGECHVSPTGYAHMTHMLSGLAGGKLVVALEVSNAVHPSLRTSY